MLAYYYYYYYYYYNCCCCCWLCCYDVIAFSRHSTSTPGRSIVAEPELPQSSELMIRSRHVDTVDRSLA